MADAIAANISSTLSGINQLPDLQKRQVYARLVPSQILTLFNITPDLHDVQGRDLFTIHAEPGTVDTELMLYPYAGAPDPVLHGHLTDTLYGHVHVLLYVINNPEAPRFNIDRMPDGRLTQLGSSLRNLPEEQAALLAGLAPGQVRSGLRLLPEAILAFETFVQSLGQSMYSAEPLYYHNAILFERYGMAYQQGRGLMERIQAGFSPGGALLQRLDSQYPFRQPGAAGSIRLRSWAIHDNILEEPFSNVVMYKHVGKRANVHTCVDCEW